MLRINVAYEKLKACRQAIKDSKLDVKQKYIDGYFEINWGNLEWSKVCAR